MADNRRDSFLLPYIEASGLIIDLAPHCAERIPLKGAQIILANRLFGGADPLIMIHQLKSIRIDFKVMTYEDLSGFHELSDHTLLIDPQKSEDQIREQLLFLLNAGQLVVIYPALRRSLASPVFRDSRWNPKIMRSLFGLSFPIQTAFLSAETYVPALHPRKFSKLSSLAFFKSLGKNQKRIILKIGKPVEPSLLSSFSDPKDYSRYLRARLFALGKSIEINQIFKPLLDPFQSKSQQEIIPFIEPRIILAEINNLQEEALLFQQAEFSVYLASPGTLDHTLKEIGRLRELTFREVGEGTGASIDVDEYDMYYHQLILWDHENHKIAGGYRIGFGGEILRLYGKRGLYISTLFQIKSEFRSLLEHSMELGRSYITPDYQKARLPLFLLWRGILSTLIKNPDYKYLIGPVSISNDYSKMSRSLIVAYIKRYYWNERLASMVKPRKAFKLKGSFKDVEVLVERMGTDLKDLDTILEEIDPIHARLPVLVKKYILQNAEIIGFNLDRKFSNALDGFMVLNMEDVPRSTLDNLQKSLK
jgi:putative hemolysin